MTIVLVPQEFTYVDTVKYCSKHWDFPCLLFESFGQRLNDKLFKNIQNIVQVHSKSLCFVSFVVYLRRDDFTTCSVWYSKVMEAFVYDYHIVIKVALLQILSTWDTLRTYNWHYSCPIYLIVYQTHVFSELSPVPGPQWLSVACTDGLAPLSNLLAVEFGVSFTWI